MENPFANRPELEASIRRFEERTGLELIVVATPVSDPYPGASWRAGAVLGTLVTLALIPFTPWESYAAHVFVTAALIGLAAWGLARSRLHHLFLLPSEVERETSEKAAQLFSQFQRQDQVHRASLLVFLSLAEHRFHILVDSTLTELVSQRELESLVTLFSAEFKEAHFCEGLTAGIDKLEAHLLNRIGKQAGTGTTAVADHVFWFAD